MLPEVVAENPTAVVIHQQLPEAIVDARSAFGELTLGIAPAQIVDVCRLLKSSAGFELSLIHI